MIKQITDSITYLEICDKLDYVKDCKLSKSALYGFMIAGDYNKQTFTYASYDDSKMNGCTILHLNKGISGNIILFIIFQWIDTHYPKLWLEFMQFIEQKAKEFQAKKISFTTSRSEKAIDKKIGKYGYKKIYSIYEKDVV